MQIIQVMFYQADHSSWKDLCNIQSPEVEPVSVQNIYQRERTKRAAFTYSFWSVNTMSWVVYGLIRIISLQPLDLCAFFLFIHFDYPGKEHRCSSGENQSNIIYAAQIAKLHVPVFCEMEYFCNARYIVSPVGKNSSPYSSAYRKNKQKIDCSTYHMHCSIGVVWSLIIIPYNVASSVVSTVTRTKP